MSTLLWLEAGTFLYNLTFLCSRNSKLGPSYQSLPIKTYSSDPYQKLIQLSFQATIATDNTLRIYDCVEQPSLTSWQLTEEFDVQSTPPPTQQPGYLNNQTLGIATPTQTYAAAAAAAGAVGEIGASASLVTQALQQQQQQQQSAAAATAAQRQQLGNREADGGWCLSWCKDKYWGEVVAVGCGTSGIIKVKIVTEK